MDIDVSDLRAAGRDLGAAVHRVDRTMRLIVRKTAYDMERGAKARAKVDTGFNRNSISTDITEHADGIDAEIGPTSDYGIWQEIGTSRMPPAPYLAPSFDQHIGPCERALAIAAGDIW